MKGRALGLIRALGALIVTGALIVGVPVLLVTLVGNPFPAELPTAEEIRILLTQNGQGFSEFLMSTLAVVIWFIWLQLVVALIVEISATLRRVETRSLPVAPGLQSFAARLVAAMTLAATLTAGPVLAPAVGALNLDSFAPVADSTPGTTFIVEPEPTAAMSAAPAEPTPAAGSASVLAVTDRTELWDLAEAAYGDGLSWRLIAEANAGGVDAGGTTISADTEAVAAGTVIRLPGPVENESLSGFGMFGADDIVLDLRDDRPTVNHTIESGDSMWSIAERQVEDELGRPASDDEVAEYWAKVVDLNADVPSGDIDLIFPGDELRVPLSPTVAEEGPPLDMAPDKYLIDLNAHLDRSSVGPSSEAPSPSDEAPAVQPEPVVVEELAPIQIKVGSGQLGQTASEAIVGQAGAFTIEDVAGGESDGQSGAAARHRELLAAGSIILGVGLIGALRRRRSIQRRTRPTGTVVQVPTTEAAAFEAALLHAADSVIESQTGTGWRVLPAELVVGDHAPVTVPAQIIGDGTVTPIAFIEPDQLGSIATPTENGAGGWDDASAPTMPAEVDGIAASVIVGTDTQTGDAVLIDLTAHGQVNLQGSSADLERFARTMVLDLAVSDRADDVRVIGVGIGSELDHLERVHTVETYASAVDEAIRSGHASADSDTSVVVVASSLPGDPASVEALREAGVLLIGPGLNSRLCIDIDDGQAVIAPVGTTVTLTALADDDFGAVVELIETSSPDAVEQAEPNHALAPQDSSATPLSIEPGPVEVRILGPVEVEGASPFSSRKAIDVVTYLAFHRNGADADQIKTWVWPTFDPPTDKAFANVLSRARTGLGVDEHDEPFLSRAGADRTYRLSDAVTTDFDRFRAFVAAADECDNPARELDLLREALELIRGVPFSGGGAGSFVWADNHVRANVDFTIDEAVHRCADLALDVGDLATGRWAALKGHELVPGCEQCFRRRFLIASAGKNRSELRRAMADLEASAAVDLGEPEAVDAISSELLDLYHDLDQSLVAGPA